MQVGELAGRTGVSARSLRHYDRAGLLPSIRLSNDYRDFSAGAVGQVARIRTLLEAGLSLDEVRPLLDCFLPSGELKACDALRAALDEQIREVEQKMSSLDGTRQVIRQIAASLVE